MKMKNSLHEFIKKSIGNYTQIVSLHGDASSRKYFRVFTEKRSFILCEDTNLKDNLLPNSYPYFIVYNLFNEENIPVPKVHHINNNNGLYLLQDLGDGLLEAVYNTLPDNEKKRIYSELIEIIVKIQKIKRETLVVPFQMSFNIEKLMYEFNFFIDHALIAYFNSKITPSVLNELKSEFMKVSTILYKPKYFVLNHRDFHSRNVLIHKGRPFIIDFQDARLGLPQYDLVSLLRDSYTVIDEDSLCYLKEYYYNLSKEAEINPMTLDEFEFYFDIMAFQRNIKAIGTFAYQITSLGRNRYKRYIEPSLRYLSDYVNRREELKRAGNILHDNIEVNW